MHNKDSRNLEFDDHIIPEVLKFRACELKSLTYTVSAYWIMEISSSSDNDEATFDGTKRAPLNFESVKNQPNFNGIFSSSDSGSPSSIIHHTYDILISAKRHSMFIISH